MPMQTACKPAEASLPGAGAGKTNDEALSSGGTPSFGDVSTHLKDLVKIAADEEQRISFETVRIQLTAVRACLWSASGILVLQSYTENHTSLIQGLKNDIAAFSWSHIFAAASIFSLVAIFFSILAIRYIGERNSAIVPDAQLMGTKLVEAFNAGDQVDYYIAVLEKIDATAHATLEKTQKAATFLRISTRCLSIALFLTVASLLTGIMGG